MRKVKCPNKHNCLNCPLHECVHDLENKLSPEEVLENIIKSSESKRHSRYYQSHREEILEKQKKRNAEIDRSAYSKRFYAENKEKFKKKRRESYVKNHDKQLASSNAYYAKNKDEVNRKRREKRRLKKVMDNQERIRALVGNIKNWSWDIFPQFKLEKEDAIALQDLEAMKAYIAEREKYDKDKEKA